MKYASPQINENDIKAVSDVLKSENLTQGKVVTQFEEAICKFTGAKYCVTFNSATSALFCAFYLLSKEIDTIAISSFGYQATYNMAKYHIKNVFIEDAYYGVQATTHFAGIPNDGYFTIDDASHAFGSSYKNGDMVGCGKYSKMTIFSFHAIKNITTGEGGAITTNNDIYYRELNKLKNHGIIHTNKASYPTFGFNFRMSDIQAALGLSQLKRIDMFKEKRYYLVCLYNRLLNPLFSINRPHGKNIFYHLYVIEHPERDLIRKELSNKGIETSLNYWPAKSFYPTGMSRVDSHIERCLSLPLHCNMTKEDVEFICGIIKAVIQ